MTAKREDTVVVTPEIYEAARRRVTPELLAWLDALTDDDIAAAIAAEGNINPELDDEWFARARPGKVPGVLIAPVDPRDAFDLRDLRPDPLKDAAE